MKGMLALAALLGVLSVCRVQVRKFSTNPFALFLSFSLFPSRFRFLLSRFRNGRRRRGADRSGELRHGMALSPLSQANVRRTAARSMWLVPRKKKKERKTGKNTLSGSFLRSEITLPVFRPRFPAALHHGGLSNGPINDRDVARTDFRLARTRYRFFSFLFIFELAICYTRNENPLSRTKMVQSMSLFIFFVF